MKVYSYKQLQGLPLAKGKQPIRTITGINYALVLYFYLDFL